MGNGKYCVYEIQIVLAERFKLFGGVQSVIVINDSEEPCVVYLCVLVTFWVTIQELSIVQNSKTENMANNPKMVVKRVIQPKHVKGHWGVSEITEFIAYLSNRSRLPQNGGANTWASNFLIFWGMVIQRTYLLINKHMVHRYWYMFQKMMLFKAPRNKNENIYEKRSEYIMPAVFPEDTRQLIFYQ